MTSVKANRQLLFISLQHCNSSNFRIFIIVNINDPNSHACPKPWPIQPRQLGSVVVFFLTQGTVPNLHQIHFFIFCVNKGFGFLLVYSCLHYLLFKNEKVFLFCFFKVQCSPISTIKQDRESGVASLCWMEIPDQNMIMNLNILAATVRSFKMLIDYTLDLTPPLSLAPYLLPKRKRRRRNCFKIPTSTG